LDLDNWEEKMGMVGETASYSDVITPIERVTGRKMLVKQTSVEELESMIKEDEGASFYNQVRLKGAKGEGTVEPTLNKLLPHIKTWSIDEYLKRYWSGVELEEPSWAKDNIIA